MMVTYGMSDTHGCYDEFVSMLDKIRLSEGDELILAGDYVDRGRQNLEMLRWIEEPPVNVAMIWRCFDGRSQRIRSSGTGVNYTGIVGSCCSYHHSVHHFYSFSFGKIYYSE